MSLYLDNNATTSLHPAVKEAIIEFLDSYGNPGSMHEAGRRVKDRLDSAREEIASFLGTTPTKIMFTSCASESNNTILKSLLLHDFGFKPHMITSAIEHPSIITTARYLEKNGVDVTYLPVTKDGIIEISALEKAITDRTVLVSIMHANNEIGTVQPIEEAAKLLTQKNIFFHSDMVQAPGKIIFNLDSMDIDAASFSAHKMHAPKGIGALYFKNSKAENFPFTPLIHGGHQENGLRAGTENTIGIIAWAAACRAIKADVQNEIDYIKNLRDSFENIIKESISDIVINGESAPRKPCTSNVSFKYVEGESILLRLDMEGIAVSTGSACSTGSLDPSHVIMALHNDPETAHGSIRFSFSRENSMEDVQATAAALKKTIDFLRSISPLTPKG
ncbi:MAG: cysteine desulfurase [Spirochaetes bacterium]|nr:cysteine desulfurase [Spirochaetota bacterium]MBN2770713.1 cysteine desulfurase [Spirochaetota bacterium]